jgi:exodeoxyribonuclease VIII
MAEIDPISAVTISNHERQLRIMKTASVGIDPIALELEREGVAQRTWQELPEGIYHARPEWSKSQWCILPDEPELFEGRYIRHLPDPWPVKPTAAMEFGTAIHGTLLQGLPLKIIPPEVLSKSGSKAGGEWKQWAEEHDGGQGWLKAQDADPYKWAIDSVMANKKARALLELPGLCEHSIFWRHDNLDLYQRARIDKYCQVGGGLVVDLKTSTKPTPDSFPFACLDFKYHEQAASYSEGVEHVFGTMPEAFLFIVVGNVPPYACHVYQPDQEMMELGWTKTQEALQDLAARLKSGRWLREDRQYIQKLSLPKRAFSNFN